MIVLSPGNRKRLFVVAASLVVSGGQLLMISPASARAGAGAPTAANPKVTRQAATAVNPCKTPKLAYLPKSDRCTHGGDPAPPGHSIAKSVAPLARAALASAPAITCDGDGVTGNRVQVIYAHASDVTDRYSSFLASIRTWAAGADTIYSASAAETGGDRHLRFVTDGSCAITVPDVTLSATGDDSFDNTSAELQAAGYNRGDRKYMVLVDANVYCGIGDLWYDDQASPANANNHGPSYGRSDNGCWDSHTIAHELMHNLGGVQLSAPNSSGGGHCTDEYDVMCYSDSPNYPTMRIVCTDSAHENRFDCGHNDYYSTAPPSGSYLATHWNAASSGFLIGGTAPPPCPDASYEPDNTAAQARSFAVGNTEQHAFCVDGDQDWVSFAATAGTAYTMQTLNLSPGTDTVLDVLAADGVTLLATNDDSGAGTTASLVTYTPSTSSTLYVRSTQYTGSGSPGYTYDLRVTGSTTGSYPLSVTKVGPGAGTVTSSPSGIACGPTCSAGFPTGSSVTLTEAPAAGSSFTGWGGACSGSASCTVSMTSAQSVTASFTPVGVPVAHDFNGDGYPDVIGRTSSGDLRVYFGNGVGLSGYRVIGTGWNGMTAVFSPGDFDGDGHADVIGRTSSGELRLYPGNGVGLSGYRVIGTGWGGFSAVFSPGDFNGDGHPDVIGRTSAGELRLYPGNGVGLSGYRVIGTGWSGMTAVFSPGDFNRDGHPDVIGRTSAGELRLFFGTGVGLSGYRVIGTGWGGFSAVFSPGDFNRDGSPDVIGRTSTGDLRLYPGNGVGLSGYRLIGTGWNGLNPIF